MNDLMWTLLGGLAAWLVLTPAMTWWLRETRSGGVVLRAVLATANVWSPAAERESQRQLMAGHLGELKRDLAHWRDVSANRPEAQSAEAVVAEGMVTYLHGRVHELQAAMPAPRPARALTPRDPARQERERLIRAGLAAFDSPDLSIRYCEPTFRDALDHINSSARQAESHGTVVARCIVIGDADEAGPR